MDDIIYLDQHDGYDLNYKIYERPELFIIETVKTPTSEGERASIKRTLYYKDTPEEIEEFNKNKGDIIKSCKTA